MLTGLFLAACLALSFLLSGMEAGVFALNRLRVRQLARAGRPSAKLLHDFLEHPENFLWTILVGNTLANFLILGWVVANLHDWFPGRYRLDHRPFCRDRVFVLRAVRSAAENAVSRASQSIVPLGGPVFRPVHFVLRPLVAVVETTAAGGVALDGRARVHRPALRQPRGNARGHAGIRAGVHDRRTRHDQSRARSAKFHRPADRHAAGRRW